MLRICLKCGAYSADHTLTFCLVDGMPLVRVIPETKSWNTGTRVVEEQAKALTKQARRLKWRRVLMRAMMTLITTTVVCVVAVSSLKITTTPAPDAAPSSSPSPAPTVSTPVAPIIMAPATPTLQTTPTPTPTPTRPQTQSTIATPTPKPTPTGKATPTATPTPTPTPGLTPTPTPTPPRTEIFTATPTPTPKRECTEDDKTGEQQRIRQSVAAMLPPHTKGAVGFQIAFSDCQNAVVTVEFWENTDNPHGLVKSERKKKRFICRKFLGFWQCGRL